MASAVGMSVFVTFTFVCILGAWALWELIRRQPKAIMAVAGAGAVSLLMASPFLLEFRSSEPASTVSGGIHLEVRRFSFMAEQLAPLGLTSSQQTWRTTFYRLAFLPLNYFLELGVYLYAGILYGIRLWRNKPMGGRDLAAVAMLGASVTVCTFLASDAGVGLNDLGWRGFMPAQFILLLWAADLLDAHPPEWRLPRKHFAALILLLAIGVSSTLLDLTLLRGFNPFLDSHWFNQLNETPNAHRRLGERYAALADTYAWIRSHTPANAVVEANPDRKPYSYGLYAERPALAGEECGGYTDKAAACDATKWVLRPLFNGFGSLEAFPEVCRSYPLDIVVVGDTDGVWRIKDGWIRYYQPVYSTEFTKVFACRPSVVVP
jgi:hypothetical protein